MISRPYLLEMQSGGNGADSTGVWGLVGLVFYISIMLVLVYPMLAQIKIAGYQLPGAARPPVKVKMTAVPTQIKRNISEVVKVAELPMAAVVRVTQEPIKLPVIATGTAVIRKDVPPGRAEDGTPTTGTAETGQNYGAFSYSYYYPPFGPPNCHADNWTVEGCKDITPLGVKWSEYMGRGVAVPFSWRARLPLGSMIEVLQPSVIAGRYTVLDYCIGCDKPGYVYLDFLDNRQRLPWTAAVLIRY